MRVVAVVLAAALAAGAAAATAAPAPFTATVSAVRWSELRFTYRSGCPVGPSELRTVRVAHWGFDRRRRIGAIVVHRRVARDVVAIFGRLYAARFPIHGIVPVAAYRGSDDASMAADNTSSFNCRPPVGGRAGWSMHAYGLAIDVNPVENPYRVGGRVLPPGGTRYVDRSRVRAGMAVAGGVLVRAFEAEGWQWGGRWTRTPDYQHFSTNGR